METFYKTGNSKGEYSCGDIGFAFVNTLLYFLRTKPPELIVRFFHNDLFLKILNKLKN